MDELAISYMTKYSNKSDYIIPFIVQRDTGIPKGVGRYLYSFMIIDSNDRYYFYNFIISDEDAPNNFDTIIKLEAIPKEHSWKSVKIFTDKSFINADLFDFGLGSNEDELKSLYVVFRKTDILSLVNLYAMYSNEERKKKLIEYLNTI